MYLSRLWLNPRCRQARRDLADPYELHRTVLRAFPDAEAGGPGRVLYRLDARPDGGPPALLVQSEVPPDWSRLGVPADYLRGGPGPPKELPARFEAGRRLAFRLRANPSVKRGGKRFGLRTEAEQLAWLLRKAVAGGFAVPDLAEAVEAGRGCRNVVVTPEGMARARRRGRDPAGRLEHLAVRFDGLLTVADPSRFAETLRAGVGSAKGFGFGLFSLGPAGGRA